MPDVTPKAINHPNAMSYEAGGVPAVRSGERGRGGPVRSDERIADLFRKVFGGKLGVSPPGDAVIALHEP